jgi:type IV fimbrial biogenesis protein FimT
MEPAMKNTTIRHNRGITLIELLMTLALISILLAIAAPAFGGLVQRDAAETSRNTLTTALSAARIEAVTRTRNVVVCPSADQQYCDHSTEWQHGWIVFADANQDGDRDEGETLISAGDPQPEGVAITSTAGRTKVAYHADGTSPGSNLTLTLCDRRGAKLATSLVVNNAGRVRSGKPTAAAAQACEARLNPKPSA